MEPGKQPSLREKVLDHLNKALRYLEQEYHSSTEDELIDIQLALTPEVVAASSPDFPSAVRAKVRAAADDGIKQLAYSSDPDHGCYAIEAVMEGLKALESPGPT